jgi:hypothetical protein
MLHKTLYALCGIFALVLLAQASNAPTVTVPNTFTPGTPAKAEDVNANFTALATAINNAVMPVVVQDSAGHVIGPYMPLFFGGAMDGEGVFIRNASTPFVVQVSIDGFTSGGSLLYTTADCSGQAYVLAGPAPKYTLLNSAIVLNNTAYVIQYAAETTITFGSQNTLNGSTLQCAATSGSGTAAPVIATVNLTSLGYVPPFSLR